MATGRYTEFIPPLIESAEKYFCKEHDVTYFVFTDGSIEPRANLVCTYQTRIGWPYDTLLRYRVYEKNRELFKDQDFLFACDADMLFVGNCGDEILGERVATIHPGFLGKPGPHAETDPNSQAFIPWKLRKNYFCGGFYGGTKDQMLKIFEINLARIEIDMAAGIMAKWHDESFWNRYCVDYPPTVILSPSYCYPENWNLPCQRKLLALDKDHKEFQK